MGAQQWSFLRPRETILWENEAPYSKAIIEYNFRSSKTGYQQANRKDRDKRGEKEVIGITEIESSPWDWWWQIELAATHIRVRTESLQDNEHDNLSVKSDGQTYNIQKTLMSASWYLNSLYNTLLVCLKIVPVVVLMCSRRVAIQKLWWQATR